MFTDSAASCGYKRADAKNHVVHVAIVMRPALYPTSIALAVLVMSYITVSISFKLFAAYLESYTATKTNVALCLVSSCTHAQKAHSQTVS